MKFIDKILGLLVCVILLFGVNFIYAAGKPELIYFGASWCGPCKLMQPSIKKVATEYKNQLKVTEVDVDKQSELVNKYNIRGVPMLIMIKDGQRVATKAGVLTGHGLNGWIERYLKNK